MIGMSKRAALGVMVTLLTVSWLGDGRAADTAYQRMNGKRTPMTAYRTS